MGVVDRTVRARLGEAVTYTPGVGSPVVVNGIFDAAYILVGSGEAGVSSSQPAVFLRLSELPTDPLNDADALVIAVNAKSYRPTEIKPDGLGGVLILLHEV